MYQKRYVGLLSKIILILAILFVQSVAIYALGEAPHQYDIEYITVSGGTAGDYLLVAAKVADIIDRKFPTLTATSIPGGGVANIIRIQKGEVQFGIGYSVVTYQAYRGLGDFEDKNTKVRTVMNLWPCATQVVAPRDSDITSIYDYGKKPYDLWISMTGQGAHVIIIETLKAYGITPEKITGIGGTVHRTGMSDGARMMQDRKLDFFLAPSSLPYSQIMELNRSPGIRFLPIDGEARERLKNNLPGMFDTVIPANTYKGQKEDIPTAGFFHQLLCSSDLSDDLVYDITASIVDNLNEIKGLSAGLATIKYENLTRDIVVPLHPGAKKYFIEHNMLED